MCTQCSLDKKKIRKQKAKERRFDGVVNAIEDSSHKMLLPEQSSHMYIAPLDRDMIEEYRVNCGVVHHHVSNTPVMGPIIHEELPNQSEVDGYVCILLSEFECRHVFQRFNLTVGEMVDKVRRIFKVYLSEDEYYALQEGSVEF